MHLNKNHSFKTAFQVLLIGIVLAVISCKKKVDPEEEVDDYDREVMLTNWADNLIIPAYKDYVRQLDVLRQSSIDFTNTPGVPELQVLRNSWLEANLSWQVVSMFEIGKAEEITLRNFTNIYPASVVEIESNIVSGSYNLALPSTNDEQGFPALDYLISGLGNSDEEIVAKFSQANYGIYLLDLVNRLESLAQEVLSDWESTYRDSFIASNGSSASSSVDKVINDFLFYYEKFLRAGKVGIPAGVFSSSTIPTACEGYYHQAAAKKLFMAGLNSAQNFFNGKHFSSSATSESLKSYLDYLNAVYEGQPLSTTINGIFNEARIEAENLNEDFAWQVENDNSLMLATYDAIQKNVILLKVDMLHALGVQVDFVDSDGD